MKKRKYVFIVGGVMSSVGKGVTASSIGRLLISKGYEVTAIKADPYINVDAGTMNPTEHGEVFVTEDKDETDQDIGNYERFLNKDIYSINYMTTGRVYREVIEKERNLEYKGKCVEVVPHIPNEINRRIEMAGSRSRAEIVITEIGGTVGEYQNILFLEAARRLKLKYPEDVAFVLVSYLPVPSRVGEMKTKPTQHAARELNSAGIQADFIIARSERKLDKKRRDKLATFCGIDKENAVSAPDADSIYEIPLLFEREKLGEKVLDKLGLKPKKKQDLGDWRRFVSAIKRSNKPLKIAVVGKYFGTGDFTLADSYISVLEAVKHACWAQNRVPEMTWVDAEEYEKKPAKVRELSEYDGIIVPGGFGSRGIEGIIKAIKYVREHNIPYLGLCYGMQLATIEIARHVAGLKGASTTEIDPKTRHAIIHANPFQTKNILESKYGGTMRLGAYPCKLSKGTIAYAAYRKPKISERHRHRYEFNNKYLQKLQKAGVVFSGLNTQKNLVEIIEFEGHPFFVGVQFHPEFKSRPLDPHPLYMKWVETMIKLDKERQRKS